MARLGDEEIRIELLRRQEQYREIATRLQIIEQPVRELRVRVVEVREPGEPSDLRACANRGWHRQVS